MIDDTPIGVASLRDALNLEIQTNLTFLEASSAENAGLSLVAESENRDSAAVIATMTALLYSPMFWVLVSEFQTETHGALSYDEDQHSSGNAFSLRLLCARMYLAGVYAAARKEAA